LLLNQKINDKFIYLFIISVPFDQIIYRKKIKLKKDMGEKDYEASKDEDKNKRYSHVLESFKSLVDVLVCLLIK
jgi:hypothetical protein